MSHEKIYESDYAGGPNNFHVSRDEETLTVELTYPQISQIKYVYVNQEAVRASDGVRLHYDYERDGFVVCQPKPRWVETGENSYSQEEDWIEVGFFQSWALDEEGPIG